MSPLAGGAPVGTGASKPGWRGLAAACLLLAAAPAAGWAGDRSVTIIEGAPETAPPPEARPAPPPPEADPVLPNAAGLSVDMVPARNVAVGELIVFRIATRSPGYLLLFDIDAGGRVAQIYPSAVSLARLKAAAVGMNAITPANPVRVPDPTSPLANFAFRAAPPRGGGLIVAALRDSPVSQVELGGVATGRSALRQLLQAIRGGGPADAWSFATLGYTIR